MLRICLAGATGWAGCALARSIAEAPDLELVAAVARKHAGRLLGEVLGEPRLTGRICASAVEALEHPCDVLVEYTKPDSARNNIGGALERGTHVVVGTCGLTDDDFVPEAALTRTRTGRCSRYERSPRSSARIVAWIRSSISDSEAAAQTEAH